MKPSSAIAAMLLGLSSVMPATAEPIRLAQTFAADIVPPYEVFTVIRSMGMRPLGRPHYRGRFYVVHAVDRRGEEVRVMVDARAARVVSVRPFDRQAAIEYDGPVYRRYDSGPLGPAPRVIESEPRYVPPRAVPPDPRYSGPQYLPEDYEDYPGDRPEEFEADEGETGSLPSRDAPRSLALPRTLPAVSSTRSAAVTPPKAPLPRPRPAQMAKAAESVAAVASPGAKEDSKAEESKADIPVKSEAETQKAEAQKPDSPKAETPKPAVRIIEIKRPEPRI